MKKVCWVIELFYSVLIEIQSFTQILLWKCLEIGSYQYQSKTQLRQQLPALQQTSSQVRVA